MAKYGRKASEKVEKTMRERKRGTLRSSSGKKVTSKKQAIAIGLSEARREGGKVPSKGSSRSSSRKSSSSRSSSTRSSGRSRGASAKRSSSRKSSSRK